MLKSLQFRNWAQPVVSRPRALVAVLLWYASAATGHRVLNHAKHVAWQRACGV